MATLLRFKQLQQRRIVSNWPQLKELIEKHGFPVGKYLSPNVRIWDEDEIDAWLASRPLAEPDALTAEPEEALSAPPDPFLAARLRRTISLRKARAKRAARDSARQTDEAQGGP
jgi:predicted DNA-binding transcriptional regulator AlpA